MFERELPKWLGLGYLHSEALIRTPWTLEVLM